MELSVWIAISLLLALVVLGIVVHSSRLYALAILRKLPGPKRSWLFGNALHLSRQPDEMLAQMLRFADLYHKEGMFCLWFGPAYPVVFVFKPELVEDLLNSSKHIGKSPDYNFLHPWLSTGLLTSGGSKWKTRRRQITPTFHFRILNNFIQVFEEQAVIMVSHLEVASPVELVIKKKVKKGVFNIMPYISRCALDVICGELSVCCNTFPRMSELVQKRQMSPWLWYDALYYLMPSGREHSKCLKILHDFTNKVIDERIAERAARIVAPQENQEDSVNDEEVVFKRKKRLAFLDLLLEAYDNGEISREGVREEVDTFMFEGHDTTAAGITWALYLLARHPEIQQRTHEEVDNFFGFVSMLLQKKTEEVNCIWKLDAVVEARTAEKCTEEAQRLFPSVPFIGRAVSEDYNLSGYIAPKGTSVVASIVALHRNPEVWPAPLQFDPDRFLPENSQGRHPFAFIPFSAGPRNCIGQRFALLEEKIVLSYILRNFSIDSTQTVDELHTCSELITRPKEGIYVTIAKR
ncbi:PREDICTED: cytochrome P450 4c3-like [Acropora digitifera]|uniref:cytochrome P450 4c3-like n=1 Tax=Acropora digitifera TaxID=70779 RepID=UPI00077A716C|nr:PREDICTED: cytochrome P450 4c3-like [Acropora digitifera]